MSNQKHILNELKSYHSNLFKLQDLQLENFDLNELLCGYHVNKLDNLQSESTVGPLTYTEIHMALKQMKNNKTPGIDVFPAEFFEVFWKQLGMVILKALNKSFEKGTLSTSLRQCLISMPSKEMKTKTIYKKLACFTNALSLVQGSETQNTLCIREIHWGKYKISL